MNQLEENIVMSFKRAKTDIIGLQKQVIGLAKKQEQLMEMISKVHGKEVRLESKVSQLKPKVIKVNGKRAKVEFVASKYGKKYHIKECPFAHNIKPKSKISFKSKTAALNKNYKPCECVR